MSLRERIRELVLGERYDELETLVAEDARAVRYLMAMSYRPEPEVRRAACRGIAMAARHHPELVQQNVRRLVWAMNDESGTNALSAPGVLLAIARAEPGLLVPVVPDLTRLIADPGLAEGLTATLELVKERCPGQVGERLTRSLQRRLGSGGRRTDGGPGGRRRRCS
jgi:hypothetical protein